MNASDENEAKQRKWIEIEWNGPYHVHGDVPLVKKTQVVSEYGEPLTWKKGETLKTTSGEYLLCRCGHSKEKPFCDTTHLEIGFDGTETADTGPTADRQEIQAGQGIVVKRDHSLCTDSGFCGNRFKHIAEMVPDSANTQVRELIMAMIERCPSGSFTYSLEAGGADVEVDLPQQVAATTEITSDGPISGPLWVTGGIPIERSDGAEFETRNRVTLCNCGKSKNKPLCDGSHKE